MYNKLLKAINQQFIKLHFNNKQVKDRRNNKNKIVQTLQGRCIVVKWEIVLNYSCQQI